MAPLIIANWKMNLTLDEATLLIKNILKKTKDHTDLNLIIAPPTPYICHLKANFDQLNFCAQDVSIKSDFGSYTGENSVKFFKNCRINYAIIGHLERRNFFGETNLAVKTKAQNCLDNNINPIICIGESLDIRNEGNYKEFLFRQLEESTPKTNKLLDKIIIAYEPAWSIGTGILPTLEQIYEITSLIRSIDSNYLVVYGGSVNSKNYADIMSVLGIDGLLVGSASLNKDELCKILNLP